jgi:hypothetical protein
MSHPFDSLPKDDYHKRSEDRVDASFEESKLQHLFGMFRKNIGKEMADLRQRNLAKYGYHQATFEAFHEKYQDFPLFFVASRLGGVKLHVDPNSLIPAMFRNFTNTPYVKAYDIAYTNNLEKAADRKIGLVFPRKGIRNGLVIYETEDLFAEIPIGAKELVFTYVVTRRKKQSMLVVRAFQKVLEAIKSQDGWTPDSN